MNFPIPNVLGTAEAVAETTGMERDAWLDLRRVGIGGSDAAAICGQSPYKSAFEVWLEKTAAPGVDDRDTEPMEWGRRLEPVVADALGERTGLELSPVPYLLRSPEHPYMLASPDRAAWSEERGWGVAEVKTAGYFAGADWSEDRIPDAYLLQGLHYLSVTGLDWCVYGCLVGGQTLHTRWVVRDEDLIAHLRAIELDFWHKVEDHTPPEPDGLASTTEFIKQMFTARAESVVTLDETALAVLSDYVTAAAMEKEAERAKDAAANRLRLMIGEHETALDGDGRTLFTYKATTSDRLDQKALAEAHPDITEAFKRPSVSRRLFVPKFRKESLGEVA